MVMGRIGRPRTICAAALMAVLVWPGGPLIVLAWSLHSAAGTTAQVMRERTAAEAALVASASDGFTVRAVSAQLTQLNRELGRAAWALGWLGGQRSGSVMGPEEGTVTAAVRGAALLARAAAEVWRVRVEGSVLGPRGIRAALDALPAGAAGIQDVRQAARSLPVPQAWRRALAGAAPLVGRLAAMRRPLAAALGFPRPARYLVLFQDGAELRATGGLLVAYGWLTMDQGRAALRYGGGILPLSRRATAQVPAGSVLHHFFGESTLSLLNANGRLGGPASTAAILRLYRSVPEAPPVVGVVLVNSWWIAGLFGLSGPVAVPSPQGRVVLTTATAPRQLEQLAERDQVPGLPRMAFLGPVVDALAARLMPHGVPSAALLGAVCVGVQSGGVLWEPDGSGLARLVGSLGWSGALWPPPAHDNYLMLVNQNFGGLKDNLYLTQQMQVTVAGRREQMRLALTLPHRVTTQTTWLLGSYEGYVSVVVPRGTRLVRATGFVSPVVVGSQTAPPATVVGGAVTVPVHLGAPSSAAAVSLTLQLPSTVAPDAPLVVQAQPGWRPGSTGFRITVGRYSVHWQDPRGAVLAHASAHRLGLTPLGAP